MKTVFDLLSEWNIRPTWTFIHIGMHFAEYEYRIKREDVETYLLKLLSGGANPESETLYIKLLDTDTDTYAYSGIVESLAKNENADADTENRKWILYVVYSAISNLGAIPTMDELFLLGDLYGYLGEPDNYPINPKKTEYIGFTDFDEMRALHKVWINSEINELSNNCK